MRESLLTFVVPAPQGCNLRCPFCIVHQRNEVAGAPLRPDEFVQFITEAGERESVHALSIQGYEPLLPESLEYTQAILEAGGHFGIPANLVTNGVYLGAALDLLSILKPNRIGVSLDSFIGEVHDRIRGVPGSWYAAVDGLRRAVNWLAPETGLTVISVLLPSKVENLLGMPQLLANIGVSQWIVDPVLAIGKRRSRQQEIEILRACQRLQAEAHKHGILFACDDEFATIDQVSIAETYPELADVYVRCLEDNIELFRLTPSGQCSAGSDILTAVTPQVPRWLPNAIHAADFLAALPRPPRARANYS
jgi:MoaA/NifB/PqqE/SkfB family radical SAM enzyme